MGNTVVDCVLQIHGGMGYTRELPIEASVAKIPVCRSGKPRDIANAVAFFADENSSSINGQVIYVAGEPKT
ncbi:3-ketoacyl-ACP reductase [Jeotgalibacillus soli]|uniref:3-ketoacyl-ACP reductase n=1 Tax=Jeotgalibacillus soli TaxID=889306 RepID=A0A0C2R542_9BACL|nr:3-ketoacyl-ACP reductase [Jeotgalibacillus soli]